MLLFFMQYINIRTRPLVDFNKVRVRRKLAWVDLKRVSETPIQINNSNTDLFRNSIPVVHSCNQAKLPIYLTHPPIDHNVLVSDVCL